ncbi:zinc finger protein 883-like [Neocloeon triangulifer]|uniref:zinc finger protein 883-like n=1 Tax=Neocloeon triangulifer TaxID=2078957 RepID=UPI00286EEDD9|nr:zinc finger protein 883-like [Neocloeon triangulifer]
MRKKVGDVTGPACSSGFAPLYTPQKPPPALKKQREHSITCLKCKRTFALTRHYKKHMQGHEKNDCKLCNKLFTCRKQLQRHMRETHNERLVDYVHHCNFCDKKFTRRHSLYRHLQMHAEDKQVCNFCGHFCDTKEELEAHIEQTHEESQMMCCPLCHQTFSRKQQYNAHLQSHEKYQCLTCKQGFSAWRVLQEHQQSGHQVCTEKPKHKCGICNKKFIRVSALEQHSKKHSMDKKIKCKPCNELFSNLSAYENHLTLEGHKLAMEAKNCIQESKFQCAVCTKGFQNKKAVTSHYDRVHNLKAYECCTCNYRTKFKTNLIRHIKLHFNDRSFVCELCGSAFFNLSALKDHHTFLHSETRNFVCGQCLKTFKRASELTRHMTSHSNSRPYSCTFCGKTFKRSSHLKRHREKCHNEQSVVRTVERFVKDENGEFVLTPLARSKSKKKPQTSIPDKTSEQAELVDADERFDDLSPTPIVSDEVSHYYMHLSTEGGHDLTYIPHQNDQPIDLEMPKNYTCSDSVTLDLAKPRHHFQAAEFCSSLDSDTRFQDSVMEEFVQRHQARDSPLYLADLSRYGDSQILLLPDFGRNQGDVLLGRDEHNLSIPVELTAEDLRHLQQHHFGL